MVDEHATPKPKAIRQWLPHGRNEDPVPKKNEKEKGNVFPSHRTGPPRGPIILVCIPPASPPREPKTRTARENTIIAPPRTPSLLLSTSSPPRPRWWGRGVWKGRMKNIVPRLPCGWRRRLPQQKRAASRGDPLPLLFSPPLLLRPAWGEGEVKRKRRIATKASTITTSCCHAPPHR